MKRIFDADKAANRKTYGYITGAVLLLAVLTVVLCIMAGVFNFSNASEAEPAVTAPQQTSAMPVTSQTQSPDPSSTPEAEPSSSPTPEEMHWSISAIAGKGGGISPSGLVDAEEGESVSFTIVPDKGYTISELKIDGETIPAVQTYTFEDVSENHTIYAVFRLATADETPAASDTPASPTDIG